MNSPAIEPENVSRRFKNVVAVDDVSFLVDCGSICAVPGGNGAGKTTSCPCCWACPCPRR